MRDKNTGTPDGNHPAPPPRMALMKLALGGWFSQAIYVAAKLGFIEIIGDGAMTPKDVAEKANAQPDTVYRLLRALASIGLFSEDKDGRFSVTPMGDCLRAERPDSLLSLITMIGEEFHQVWGDLLPSIQTGEPAFPRVFGESFFEYLQKNDTSGNNFDSCMATVHGAETDHVVSTYDFSKHSKIVDVGGGKGSLICAIMAANPHVEGVLFDLPEVIERGREYVSAAGLSDRCSFVEGSFFKDIPVDADLFLLRHIIHDWSDENSQSILKACRRQMSPDAKLLIIDCVIPAGNDWFPGKILDLQMLLLSGGKERSAVEFDDVLATSGLRMNRIIPTPLPRISIVEAQRDDST